MSGLNLLRQSLVKRTFYLRLRVFLLAILGGGGLGTSCVVPDPEYCANTEQCPSVATELGMMQQVCHPSRHVCVVSGPNTCLRNEDCTSDFKNPRCDLATNSCVPCTVGDNSSCAHFTERPLCVKPSGATETLCVACQTNSQCPKERPICDAQQCRKCSSHSDCEGEVRCDSGNLCTDSLVCIQEGDLNPDRAGQCAQNGPGSGGHVVYVNGSDMSQCGPMINATGSTLSSPLCNLDDGLEMAKLQGRHFIRAVGRTGSTLAGLNKSVTQGSYAFIGAPAPSKGFPDMVTIQHRGLVFAVSGTGSVMVDRFNIHESNPIPDTALSCSGGPTAPGLTLRNSILTGNIPATTNTFTPAVFLSGCNVIIEGNIIGVTSFADVTSAAAMAHGVGINIIDNNGQSGLSSYLIQNNVIAGNASIGISIPFGTNPTSKFVLRFNTIYGNGRGLTSMTNSGGGVGCPGNKVTEFSHSIIANNFKVGGSQVSGSNNNCGFKDIIVDAAESSADPAFTKVSSIDVDLDSMFRLLPSASWAIDKVTPAAGETLPSQDVYRVARPQNGKWDIGASEYKP